MCKDMSKQTVGQTPWNRSGDAIYDRGGNFVICNIGAGGKPFFSLHAKSEDEREQIIDRTILAMNAVEGIPDEALDRKVVKEMMEVMKYISSRSFTEEGERRHSFPLNEYINARLDSILSKLEDK